MAEKLKGLSEIISEIMGKPNNSGVEKNGETPIPDMDQVETTPTPDPEEDEIEDDEPKTASELLGEAMLEAMADMDGTSEIEEAAGLSEGAEDREAEKKPNFGAFKLNDYELGVDRVLVSHVEARDPSDRPNPDDISRFNMLRMCRAYDIDEYLTPSVASLVVEMFMGCEFDGFSSRRLIELFNALPLEEQEKIACSDVAPRLYGHIIRQGDEYDNCFTNKLCAGMAKISEDPQKASIMSQLLGGSRGREIKYIIDDVQECVSSENRRKMFETDMNREDVSRLALATALLDGGELLEQVREIMSDDEARQKISVREVVQLIRLRSGNGVLDEKRFVEASDLEKAFGDSGVLEFVSFVEDHFASPGGILANYGDANEKKCREVLDLIDEAKPLFSEIYDGLTNAWRRKYLIQGLLSGQKGELLVREALEKGDLDDDMKQLLKHYLTRYSMMDKKYGKFIHSLEDLRDRDGLRIQRVRELEQNGQAHEAKLELCEYAYHMDFGALVRELVALGVLEYTPEDRDEMQDWGGRNPEEYYRQEGKFKIRIKNLREYREKAKLSDEEYALLLDALALVSVSDETLGTVIDDCERNHPNNTRRLGEVLLNIRQRRRRELSKSFTKTMQESLAESVTEVEGEKLEYEGKPIQLLKMTGEHFRLLIHLLGAFSDKNLDDPTRWDQYDQPSRDAEGKPVGYISTCTLSEGALFVAQDEPLGEVDAIYYGFADLGEDGFLYEAEYDTYTETVGGSGDPSRVVTERQDFLYDDMDELIERTKTRRKSDEDYNEVVLDRYARNRPEPAQELLYPSYVIVFTDDPKKISERVKKHAAYFGVPILMIDPVKYGSMS